MGRHRIMDGVRAWRGRVALLALLVLVAAGCGWPQFGYVARHTRSSPDTSLSTSNVGTLKPKWTAPTSGGVFSSPAVANGVVYVGSDDKKVYAFNASTGARRWTATTGNAVSSSPAVADGVVYVGSSDAKVYAFSASTGARRWTATTGGLWVPETRPAC